MQNTSTGSFHKSCSRHLIVCVCVGGGGGGGGCTHAHATTAELLTGHLSNVQVHKQRPPSHSDRVVEQKATQGGLADIGLAAHHNLRQREMRRWKGTWQVYSGGGQLRDVRGMDANIGTIDS